MLRGSQAGCPKLGSEESQLARQLGVGSTEALVQDSVERLDEGEHDPEQRCPPRGDIRQGACQGDEAVGVAEQRDLLLSIEVQVEQR